MDRLKTTVIALFRVELQKQTLPEENIIQSEEEAALWSAMNKLDERHRIVLVLRYFHELTVTEIAGMLNLPEGTLHSRVHAARERMRIALDPAAGD